MKEDEQDLNQQTTRALFRRLWCDYVRQYWGKLLIIFGFMIVVSGLAGVYPLIIGYVFNELSVESADLVWQAPLLIVSIALIRAIALYGLARQVAVFSLLVTRHIQKRMANHMIITDLRDIMSAPSGTFVSRMTNDVNLIREALVRLINNLIKDCLTIIVLVGVLMSFDWVLTLVVFGIYPLAMRPVIAIGRRQRQSSQKLQESLGEATSTLNETVKGARMIRAYGLEDYEKKRTGLMFDMLFQIQRSLAIGRARIDPILEVLGGIAVSGIIGLAGFRVLNGNLDIGHVAGFMTAFLMLGQPIRALSTLNTILQEAGAALARFYNLLDTPSYVSSPDKPEKLGQVKGKIDFQSVSFRYADDVTLSNISFTVEPGQTLALVGPSGGGKSTIINLIPRLFDPEEGVIKLDGHDLRQLDISEMRASMALVSQDSILFNDTVTNNLAFGQLSADVTDIHTAAKAAAADDFIKTLPDGYETIMGEEGNRLSGGQRQRIAIARAMLRDAPVLLLDEPTSALDAVTEKQIQAAMQTLTKGRTTIIVAHRLATVRHADHILVIDSGEIVEDGNHDSLLAKDGVYASLFKSQHFY